MTQRNRESTRNKTGLTFTDIYRAIETGDEFNKPQLFFLSRLVQRKLDCFEARIGARDLEMKPYEH